MKANPTRKMVPLQIIKTFFLKRKIKSGNSSAKLVIITPCHVTLFKLLAYCFMRQCSLKAETMRHRVKLNPSSITY